MRWPHEKRRTERTRYGVHFFISIRENQKVSQSPSSFAGDDLPAEAGLAGAAGLPGGGSGGAALTRGLAAGLGSGLTGIAALATTGAALGTATGTDAAAPSSPSTRKVATAALTSCVAAASGVPLDELADSGALEMAVVNASMGSEGALDLPSAPSAKAQALEEHQNLRLLSMQGLARIAARGAHRRLIEAGAAALVSRTLADACAVSWGEGGDCTEPLVGAAVQLAEHLASSPVRRKTPSLAPF